MKVRAACILAFGLLSGGCGAVSRSIPVGGSAADLSQLAGQWSGEYIGEAGGRRGVISFNLAAGADTASGDVLMFPRQQPETLPASETRNTGSMVMPQNLSIRFVRAANGQVSGQLDPYEDPECLCQVTTTFEGRVHGDVIEGRYVSMRSGMAEPLRGEWKVKRKRS